MKRYYVDLELNVKKFGITKKNDMIDYLFKVIHGLLRSESETKIGLSFPKFSASKDDRFPTLGRVFRLVSNDYEALRNFVSKNSIDNLLVSEIILIGDISEVPREYVSEYVFKRHHPNPQNKASTDECAYVNLEKNGNKYRFYIKRTKIDKIENSLFTSYGLGNYNGPSVPIF